MTLAAYLFRLVFSRIGAVLTALTALVLLIEMLEVIRRVLGVSRGVGTVLTYLALRLPLAVDRLLPLAVLLGTAIAFGTLARNNEIAILRAAGLSPLRLIRLLLPVAAVWGCVNFLLEDSLGPATERAFATWWQDVAHEDDEKAGTAPPQWLHVDGQIVSIGHITDDGRRLENVTRYGRDSEGRLTLIARAKTATFDGREWRLEEETATFNDGVHPSPSDGIWANGPDVENMRQLTLRMDRVSGTQARQVLAGDWIGTDGTAHYRIIVQRGYAAFIIPLVMLLLAVPALHGGRRTGNLLHGMASSLGLGLAFLIVNGLFLSMGEASAIPATLAVWISPLSFTLLGIGVLLHFEE